MFNDEKAKNIHCCQIVHKSKPMILAMAFQNGKTKDSFSKNLICCCQKMKILTTMQQIFARPSQILTAIDLLMLEIRWKVVFENKFYYKYSRYRMQRNVFSAKLIRNENLTYMACFYRKKAHEPILNMQLENFCTLLQEFSAMVIQKASWNMAMFLPNTICLMRDFNRDSKFTNETTDTLN